MRARMMFMLMIGAVLLSPGTLIAREPGAQAQKAPAVRNMEITGEIAKAAHGYIIRGKTPAEVFSILNPDPDVLEAFVKNGKTIRILVRIVSGDNVEIEKIDGRHYSGRR